MSYPKTVEQFRVKVDEPYLTRNLPTKWSCSVTEEDGDYKIVFSHYEKKNIRFFNFLVVVGYRENWADENFKVLMSENVMKDNDVTLKSTTGKELTLEMTVFAETDGSQYLPLLGVDLADKKIDHDHVLTVGAMKLYVKKSILSFYSAYFERHFNGNFKEATQNETPIQEVSLSELKDLLQFLYPGTHSITDENVVYLWTLADRFAILKRYKYLRAVFVQNGW